MQHPKCGYALDDFAVEREGYRRLAEAPSVCSTPFPEPAAAPAKTRITSGIADGFGLWDRKSLPVAAMAWMPPAPYRVTGRALHSHFVLFGDLDISGDRLPPGFVVLHDELGRLSARRSRRSYTTDCGRSIDHAHPAFLPQARPSADEPRTQRPLARQPRGSPRRFSSVARSQPLAERRFGPGDP